MLIPLYIILVKWLGLGSSLRRLAEEGDRSVLHLYDGTSYDGTPARVGADFVELVTTSGPCVLVTHESLAAVQGRG